MSSQYYDEDSTEYELLELSFFDNIYCQIGEICRLLPEAKKMNLDSFEFDDIIFEITIKEENVIYLLREAKKSEIYFDNIENSMDGYSAKKKQIIIDRDNKYKTNFYDHYYDSSR